MRRQPCSPGLRGQRRAEAVCQCSDIALSVRSGIAPVTAGALLALRIVLAVLAQLAPRPSCPGGDASDRPWVELTPIPLAPRSEFAAAVDRGRRSMSRADSATGTGSDRFDTEPGNGTNSPICPRRSSPRCRRARRHRLRRGRLSARRSHGVDARLGLRPGDRHLDERARSADAARRARLVALDGVLYAVGGAASIWAVRSPASVESTIRRPTPGSPEPTADAARAPRGRRLDGRIYAIGGRANGDEGDDSPPPTRSTIRPPILGRRWRRCRFRAAD